MENHDDSEARLRQLQETCERMEAELKQALATEKRARADLQQFVSIISHDLRSPISTASNFLALISAKYGKDLDPKVKEYIGYSITSLKGMEKLISDLLAYAKAGSRRLETAEVDLNTVLAHALSNLRGQMKEAGASVSADRLPAIKGDEILLVQLFQNLISNGIIWGGQAPQIRISAMSRNGEWLIGFRDSGLGIKPEDQKKIFKPFGRAYHASVPHKGTGLGLSISRRIVERHGGLIWVESAPGEGSTFYLTLPKEKESSSPNPLPSGRGL